MDQAESKNSIGSGVEVSVDIISTPKLRAEIVRAFDLIEKYEEEVNDGKKEIENVIDTLVAKGLHKKAVKLALARRKLALNGTLANVDGSMRIICGIDSLGIQGDLFEG